MNQYADEHWMKQALNLARHGIGTTHPNPRVGAVIVRNDQCIGSGWHVRPGQAHAEVVALADSGPHTHGATLYVTLEPCAGTGRTPPCTEAILAAGIRRVVFPSSDPNPNMCGGGVFLQTHGVDVESGLLRRQADELNAPFFHFMRTGMPYAIAKAATSLDGKMASRTNHSQWISSQASRTHAHALRASVDAIIVGSGTFIHDNPALNIRHIACDHAQPLRVVVASQAPAWHGHWRILSEAGGPVRFYLNQATEYDADWHQAGVEIVYRHTLNDIFKHLAETGHLAVLIEGGGRLHASALEARLVQECVLYQAPILIGGVDAPGFWQGLGVERVDAAIQVKVLERQMLDGDQMIRGTLIYPET